MFCAKFQSIFALLLSARKYYKVMLDRSLHHIMRPNLILYLDAPVDVVSKIIF